MFGCVCNVFVGVVSAGVWLSFQYCHGCSICCVGFGCFYYVVVGVWLLAH